jgi:hypothetical protein
MSPRFKKGDRVFIINPQTGESPFNGTHIIESPFTMNNGQPFYTIKGIDDTNFHENWIILDDPFGDDEDYFFGIDFHQETAEDEEDDGYIFFNDIKLEDSKLAKKEKKKEKKKNKQRKEAKRMDQALDHYRFLVQMYELTHDDAYFDKAEALLERLKSGDKKINIKDYTVYKTDPEEGSN